MAATHEPANPRLVQVGDKLFPELQFINAMTEAGLAHVTSAVPKGATVRKAMRAVAACKTNDTLQIVRKKALKLLLEHGTPVKAALGVNVVARFPRPD